MRRKKRTKKSGQPKLKAVSSNFVNRYLILIVYQNKNSLKDRSASVVSDDGLWPLNSPQYIRIYRCHKIKIDFSFPILASNKQTTEVDKCWKTKCLYIYKPLEFAITDHPAIVKVTMLVIIQLDVSTFFSSSTIVLYVKW
jgi:hypothetical protein